MPALARSRPVSRISISLPEDLLSDLDRMVEVRGFESRSQAVNDMLHQFLLEHKCDQGDDVMVEVISSLHVHLMHNQTMEVILVQGPARKLQMIADELTSRRGVVSGKMHLIAALIPQLHPFIDGAKQPQGAA
jgi:CopG family nickel-responsive transcriptional regulator